MTGRNRSLPATAVAALGLSLFALLAGGCSVHFVEQELRFLYGPDEDVVDALIIYRGIDVTDTKEKTLEEALEAAGAFLDHRRIFLVPEWELSVDIDEAIEELRTPPGEEEAGEEMNPEQRALLADILDEISVVEAGLFLDPEGQLSAYQRVRLASVSRVVDGVNRIFSSHVLELVARGNLAAAYPLLDERSRELWYVRAASGRPWIRQFRDELELDLPMTLETTARLQRALIDATVGAGNRKEASVIGRFLVYLRHLEIGDEKVVLSFGAPVTGTFDFGFHHDGVEYSPRLLDALTAAGFPLHRHLNLEGVRRKLRDPPGPPPRLQMDHGNRSPSTNSSHLRWKASIPSSPTPRTLRRDR